MTRKHDRAEDLLLEMRASVSPVDTPEAARARRERTVAHLRGLQARSAVFREVRSTWRKRLLIAAALLLPSLAGASLVRWSGLFSGDREVPSTTPKDSANAARPSGNAPGHSPRLRDVAEAPAETSATPPAEDNRARRGNGTAKGAASRSSATLPQESSSLAEENRLMLAAMSARRAGDDAQAVRILTDLLTRHPASPLAQNATVERFRALKRLGDEQAASQTARRYLKDYPVGMAGDEARRLAAEPKLEGPSVAAFPR